MRLQQEAVFDSALGEEEDKVPPEGQPRSKTTNASLSPTKLCKHFSPGAQLAEDVAVPIDTMCNFRFQHPAGNASDGLHLNPSFHDAVLNDPSIARVDGAATGSIRLRMLAPV